MKVKVPGATPLERLTNFTRSIVGVPKAEIEREDAKWKRKRAPKKKPR